MLNLFNFTWKSNLQGNKKEEKEREIETERERQRCNKIFWLMSLWQFSTRKALETNYKQNLLPYSKSALFSSFYVGTVSGTPFVYYICFRDKLFVFGLNKK